MEFKTDGYTQPEMTLTQRLDRLTEVVEQGKINPVKPKKFRLPARGKINNKRLRTGYATIVEIQENDNVSFTREQIVDGTVKLKDTFHAVEDSDILTYKGKPMLIIPKKSKVPFNPNKVVNNTYNQKHIMSRMMNETLNNAKKLGIAGMSIGLIILVGVIAYAFIAG